MEMPASGVRPRILHYRFQDKASLYGAYMPFIENGGIFITTSWRYKLGDDIFLVLGLPEAPDGLPIAGKVVWITPPGAEGNHAVGIGIQFGPQDKGAARRTIETLLAGLLGSDRPTLTM